MYWSFIFRWESGCISLSQQTKKFLIFQDGDRIPSFWRVATMFLEIRLVLDGTSGTVAVKQLFGIGPEE